MLQVQCRALPVWAVLSVFAMAAICCMPGRASAEAPKVETKKEMFVGVWTTSRIPGGKTLVNADDTYVVQDDKGGAIDAGKWFVRDGEVVWKSKGFTPWEEDNNPVMEYTPDKFVVRELDNTTTTFTRVK